MKKRILILALGCLLLLFLGGCCLSHEWQDATCTAPKTCAKCGETEGEMLPHTWQDATCTAPKTCAGCGATEGEVLPHDWKDATCTAPKTCAGCGETEGEVLPHNWQDATCTAPKTCAVCSATEGEALGHTLNSWKVQKAATCSELGSEASVCNVCNETVTREIPMAEHTPGEWEVKVKATRDSNGTEVQNCSVCATELGTRSYEFVPFDITPLKNKRNFEYDDFSKSWKYYTTYKKNYSDATVSITLIAFSEDNGTNVEDFELRAGVYWKDESKDAWVIDTVEFIVGDKIYSCKMTTNDGKAMGYTFLITDTSYQMIQDLAECSSVKAKLSYADGGSTEINVGSALKIFCQDILTYDVWSYYFPASWVGADTTTVR